MEDKKPAEITSDVPTSENAPEIKQDAPQADNNTPTPAVTQTEQEAKQPSDNDWDSLRTKAAKLEAENAERVKKLQALEGTIASLEAVYKESPEAWEALRQSTKAKKNIDIGSYEEVYGFKPATEAEKPKQTDNELKGGVSYTPEQAKTLDELEVGWNSFLVDNAELDITDINNRIQRATTLQELTELRERKQAVEAEAGMIMEYAINLKLKNPSLDATEAFRRARFFVKGDSVDNGELQKAKDEAHNRASSVAGVGLPAGSRGSNTVGETTSAEVMRMALKPSAVGSYNTLLKTLRGTESERLQKANRWAIKHDMLK